MDKRVFRLAEELRRNLQNQWTVGKMAEFAGMSAPHFQKLFKKNMQAPPAAYLRDLRLEKARELLGRQDKCYQISEIRKMVGIEQDSHFTRDFKKKYGVTPTAYSKQYSEKIQAEMQIGKK